MGVWGARQGEREGKEGTVGRGEEWGERMGYWGKGALGVGGWGGGEGGGWVVAGWGREGRAVGREGREEKVGCWVAREVK